MVCFLRSVEGRKLFSAARFAGELLLAVGAPRPGRLRRARAWPSRSEQLQRRGCLIASSNSHSLII